MTLIGWVAAVPVAAMVDALAEFLVPGALAATMNLACKAGAVITAMETGENERTNPRHVTGARAK